MFKNKEQQLNETVHNNIDITQKLLQASISSIEQLTQIQLDASKKIFDDAAQTIKSITNGDNNPKDFIVKINELTATVIENNLTNYNSAYEVVKATQTQLGKVFESYFQTSQEKLRQSMDSFAGVGNQNTMNDIFKVFLNNTHKTMDNINKVTTQMVDVANNNIKNANNIATNVVKSAKPAK